MSKDKKMVVSNFNLQIVSTTDYAQAIHSSAQTGKNLAVFGRRGSGKTMIAKESIKDVVIDGKHCKEIYWNLSTMERVDVGGYPDLMGSTNDFVSFKLPASYEPMIKGNQPVIVLMDEVDKADPSLWAPLLEFTQFHTINGRPLPNLKSVIMTGNLISEGGNKPCLPLLDRVSKFLIEPDVNSWMEWAGKSRAIHPSVTAYINDYREDLYGDVDPDNSYADPSPRSWQNASDFLFYGDKAGWSLEQTYKMVAGCVGNSVGLKYKAYFEHYHKILPIVNKAFQGHDVTAEFKALKPTERVIIAMIAANRVAGKLDEEKQGAKLSKETNTMLTNAAKLLIAADPEYCLIAVRSQLTIQRLVKYSLDDHADFGKVLARVRNKAAGK